MAVGGAAFFIRVLPRGYGAIIISHLPRIVFRAGYAEKRQSDKNHICATRHKTDKDSEMQTKSNDISAVAKELTERAVEMAAALRADKLTDIPMADFERYNKRFAEFRSMLDALGTPPADSAPALKALTSAQIDLESAIKSVIEKARKNLTLLRKAREVFNNFVRRPELGDARFYDKRG